MKQLSAPALKKFSHQIENIFWFNKRRKDLVKEKKTKSKCEKKFTCGFKAQSSGATDNLIDLKSFREEILKLDQRVKQELPKTESFEEFISSHLQQTIEDQQQFADYKKMMAISKMVALVNCTLDDMNKIELKHICSTKG